MSINRRLGKENVVYNMQWDIHSLKKEDDPVACYNMDKTWGHYAKQNKPVTEAQILYDSTHMYYLK